MDEQNDRPTDELPKKKGWPKGKPRGPRKLKIEPVDVATPPPIQEPPQVVKPPVSLAEPVGVSLMYKTGHQVVFAAADWETTPTEYRFMSFPEERGFKQLSIIQKSEIAVIQITAPERYFEKVKETSPVPKVAAKAEYPEGDPQVSIAPGHPKAVNRAKSIPGSVVPKSVVTEYDADGSQVEVVRGAAMV